MDLYIQGGWEVSRHLYIYISLEPDDGDKPKYVVEINLFS
jgi:hypothetical protein